MNDNDFKIYKFGRSDFPCVSFANYNSGHINSKACDLLDSDRITFARDKEGNLLICFLPKNCEISGVKVSASKNFSTKVLKDYLQIESGYYKIELEETLQKKDLVWYYLTKLNDL